MSNYANVGKVFNLTHKQGADSPNYEIGPGLKLEGLTLSVNTVDSIGGDGTLPITAGAVQAVVGNIEALLGAI